MKVWKLRGTGCADRKEILCIKREKPYKPPFVFLILLRPSTLHFSRFLFSLSEPPTIYPAPPYLPKPCPQFSMFPSNSCLLYQPALSFHLSFASQCFSITNRKSLHPSLLSADILDFKESCPHLLLPPSCSSALAESFPVSLILISTN